MTNHLTLDSDYTQQYAPYIVHPYGRISKWHIWSINLSEPVYIKCATTGQFKYRHGRTLININEDHENLQQFEDLKQLINQKNQQFNGNIKLICNDYDGKCISVEGYNAFHMNHTITVTPVCLKQLQFDDQIDCYEYLMVFKVEEST